MGKKTKIIEALNGSITNQEYHIPKEETITNLEGRKVRIIHSEASIGLASVIRVGVTDEQLCQLIVNPHPFP